MLIRAMILLIFAPNGAAAANDRPPGWEEISAIFDERCIMCHSATAGASKGLRLDDYSAALIGSERGAVLIPRDVAGSELIRRLRGVSKPRMPFLSRPLPDDQIDLIESWVAGGLPESVSED